MADATEISNIQASPPAEPGSLIVGRIRPPMAMWAALEGVTHTTPLRNGVLIIFSKNLKGRIGIFCNRYISGAVIEPGGETGLEAVRELLSIKGGMFGFRATMGDESKELAQSLGLDISELLLSKSAEGATAGEALGALMAPGSQLLRTSDVGGPEVSDADARDSSAEGEPADSVEPAAGNAPEDGSFSYLDWFADQMGEPDILPKIRQILLPALPRVMDPAQAPAAPAHLVSNDLEMYGQLLQTEQDKVTKDIERSMERGRAAKSDDTVGELELLSQFIQSEQVRAQKWTGLDAIPTPRSGASASDHRAIRKTNLRATGEYSKDCGDLLATSAHRIPVPKDFVKKTVSDDDAPAFERLIHSERLRDKRIIGVACIAILVLIIVGITVGQSNAALETSLTQAKKALQDNQPDRAIFILNTTIANDPTSQRAYFYRGMAYATTGDYEHAKSDFDEAIIRGGPAARLLLARASAACKSEQYDDAIKDCNQLLKLEPKNVEAWLIMATCYERQKNYDGVETITTKAIDATEDPGVKAHLLVQRGFARAQQRKHAEAGSDFGQAMTLKPDESTYMQRGDAYRALKRWSPAAADYSQAIDKDPRQYAAYVARGICYGALHEDKLAMKDFGRALSIDKAGVEAYIQRGSLHLSRSNYRLAANDLEDAIKLLPNDAETQQKLASVYTHLHRSVPRLWLRANNDGTSPSTGSARSMTADAEPDSVLTAKMPSDPKELVSLGYKYLTDGEVQYAVQMFAAAIKKQPNNVDARRYLAHAFYKSGSGAQAITQFDALVSLTALTPEDSLIYAKALSSARNTERAVEVLNRAVAQNPTNIGLRAELTSLYLSIGFAKKAESAYREGLPYVRTPAEKALLDSSYGSSGGTQTSAPGRGASKVKNADLGG